jgi:glutamyl-tRNA synthetase
MLPFIQERSRTLTEVAPLSEFFFVDRLDYDSGLLVGDKMTPELAVRALTEAKGRITGLSSFDHDSLEAALRPLAAELGLKTGQLFGTLRIAITGRKAAPPLFQTMVVLGKERSLERIEAALARL